MKKALARLTHYYRRIAESSLGKFVASMITGEQRTPDTEQRTANAERASDGEASARLGKLEQADPSLPLALERNVGNTENLTTNRQPPAANEGNAVGSSQQLPMRRPVSSAEIPGTAAVSVASGTTGERDAHAPRLNAPDASPPHSALRIPQSASAPNLITRNELKRELDSLRRFIESRK